MKKLFALLILIILIGGCSSELNDAQEKPIDNNQNSCEIEEKRNTNVIKKIQELLFSTIDANYAFNYDITISDKHYIYNGERYQNTIKGKSDNIEYQIENDKFYNLKTKQEIANVYDNVDYNLIDLENYIYVLADYVCTYSDNVAVCENSQENESLVFTYNSTYIESIKYQKDDIIYALKYSNYNGVNPIPLIDYKSMGISYNMTDTIQKEEVTENVDEAYTLYNYYIDNVTISNDGELINITDAYNILSASMYYNAYASERENIKQIEEFIYDNNFIIIIVDFKDENDLYYLTTTEHSKEILSQYMK